MVILLADLCDAGKRRFFFFQAEDGIRGLTVTGVKTCALPISIITLLGLDLAIPDHSTLSRRAEILALPWLQPDTAPVHLLVDSTGLRLCGPGEWLVEKHGSKRRRAWRKLHIGRMPIPARSSRPN